MLPKVGSFLNNATGVYDQLTKVARGLLCIPSALGSFLAGRTPGGGSLGAAVLNAVKNAVNTIVQNEVALVGNLVAQTLRQQYKTIQGILQSFKSIFIVASNLRNKTTDTLNYIKGTENCTHAASEMVSCLLISATNLQQRIRPISQNLQEFNNTLYDAAGSSSGIIDRKINRDLQFLDKAKMQMNLQNLL